MSNVNWDIPIIVLPRERTYDVVIRKLRSNGGLFSKYLWRKFALSIFSENPLTNESKIVIASPLLSTSKSVDVFRSDFFCGLCTIDLTTKRLVTIDSQGGVRMELRGLDMAPIETNNGKLRLLELDDTSKPCSSHAGVSILAITRDNYMRFAIQAEDAQFSKGMKAPLGSGSFAWFDFSSSKTLKELIYTAARRELREEWGKLRFGRSVIEFDKMISVGYFRMPHRGGRPEFVVFCKLRNNLADLSPDISEVWEDTSERALSQFRVGTVDELKNAVERTLVEQGSRPNSVSLFGSLFCLRQVILARPEIVREIAGYQ